jgi:hypothetical protein
MKIRSPFAVSAVLALCLFSGCYTARVVARGSAGETHSETGFSLLWGITETKSSAIECEYGVQSVTTYFPWYHGILYGITAGIVMPVVKEYTCLATPSVVAMPVAPVPQ